MPTTKRIQYDQYGGPDVLHMAAFTAPAPGEGEVLVRVLAAAANPMDAKIRNGDTKLITGRKFPRGLGHDFAGTVEAVGAGVTRFHVGDAVLGAMSLKAAGAFADLVVADEKQVVGKPEQLSYEQAAALPTVGVTALQALTDKGRLQAGQAVFINGCLGGVGRTAAQLALMKGASVAGSCRASARPDALALGIDPVVDFSFDPTPLAGKFDLVFDTAGVLPLKAARALLKPGGRIIDINASPAKMAKAALPGPLNVLIAKYTTPDLEEIAAAAARGDLAIPIARTVPLTDAIKVLTQFERNHTPGTGKLIITTQ